MKPITTNRPPASVLRGPNDPDYFRVQVGRYGDRWYTDPLPLDEFVTDENVLGDVFPSVSTIKKASGSDWSAVSVKRIATALADNPKVLEHCDGLPAIHDTLRSIDRNGLQAAGNRGTNVHLMAEALLYGRPITVGIGDPGAHYRASVESFFDTYQPELVAAEFVCINRDLHGVGYGGTADAVCRINGLNYVVDWKSRGEDSAHGAYPEEAAQIAAYSRAQYVIVDGPRRERFPQINGGLIVSIKHDGFRVYPVDLSAAWEHFKAIHAWWCARRSERESIGKPWAPRAATPADTKPDTPAGERDVLDARKPPAEDHETPMTLTQVGQFGRDFTVLEGAYKALPDDARAWVNTLSRQAQQAGVPFHASETKSLRRYHLLHSLVTLARKGETDDDHLRQLLEPIIGDLAQFASIPTGALVGSLSVTEAGRFSKLVLGELAIVVEPDGRLTLAPAA